jgi:hypothetical protein
MQRAIKLNMSFILSVTNNSIMPNVIMPSVIKLNVVAPLMY